MQEQNHPLKSLACEMGAFPHRTAAFGNNSWRCKGILWIFEHGTKLWLSVNSATYIHKYLFLNSPCVRSSSPWPGSTFCEFADLILADGCTALLPVLWVHQHWLRRHCAVLWSTAVWTCHTSAQTGKCALRSLGLSCSDVLVFFPMCAPPLCLFLLLFLLLPLTLQPLWRTRV